MKPTPKQLARMAGRLHYRGKACSMHPKLAGKRFVSNGACVGNHKTATSANRAAAQKAWRMKWPDKNAAITLAAKQKVKREVFLHYGNKCLHCGIADKEVLTVDHTNQNGADHRRQFKLKSSNALYRWLRKNKYPKEFRVLCYNCNVKAFRAFQRKHGDFYAPK